MPISHEDGQNELLTRPISQTVHALIDERAKTDHTQPFEWDLGLYYLALSLCKHIATHANAHSPYPLKKCIGTAYHYSFARAHKRATPDATAAVLFRRLNPKLWRLDGFIFSAVAGYHLGDLVYVVNVVSKGPAIPAKVCPQCCGGCHFSAKSAAVVFARLAKKSHHDGCEQSVLSASSAVSSSSTAFLSGSAMSPTTAASGLGSGTSMASVTALGLPACPGSTISDSGSGSSAPVPNWNVLTPEQYNAWHQAPPFWSYPSGYGYPGYRYG